MQLPDVVRQISFRMEERKDAAASEFFDIKSRIQGESSALFRKLSTFALCYSSETVGARPLFHPGNFAPYKEDASVFTSMIMSFHEPFSHLQPVARITRVTEKIFVRSTRNTMSGCFENAAMAGKPAPTSRISRNNFTYFSTACRNGDKEAYLLSTPREEHRDICKIFFSQTLLW